MSSLYVKYRKDIIPALQKKFGIENIMAVPKVERDLKLLSGQKAVPRKAKKSIAGFKLREGVTIGYMVTLRGKRMYDFIERLINIALPRSKDFRGIDSRNFDKTGNLNLDVKEHSIFPEIHYETLKDIFSLQITV